MGEGVRSEPQRELDGAGQDEDEGVGVQRADVVCYEANDAAPYDEAEGDDCRGAAVSWIPCGSRFGDLHGGQGRFHVWQLELDPLLEVYPRRTTVSLASDRSATTTSHP